jgi:segregation and condensation protein A
MEYEIKLDVFEGPLDLLLHLIRKNEVDIFDIPIASITDQYLEYLDMMKALNMDVAGDFLVMASTLVHIKSRMLLPEPSEGDEQEDPRMEIARPLMEYMLLKEASEELTKRPMLEREIFLRGIQQEAEGILPQMEMPLELNIFQLMDAFRRVLERSHPGTVLTFTREEWSIQERMERIIEILRESRSVFFEDLFGENRTLSQCVATFLALLELVNQGLVVVFQPGDDSRIQLMSKLHGTA